MGLPLWSILTGLRIGQGHWQQQLNSVRSFQELYSTINMGLFVGLNSETGASRERLMRDLHIGIRAHIFLCPSIFIYNLYWGEIYGTPWLHAYFNRFKSWRQFLEARLKDPSKWDFVDVTDDLLESLKFFLKKYVTQRSNADIVLNPWLFTATIRSVFDDAVVRGLSSTVTAAQAFLAAVTQDEKEAEVSFIKESVIRLLNPAIDVDWIVMKVAITQLYFYDVILRKNPGAFTGRGKPAPYVKGQRYKRYDNDIETEWTEIKDEGLISLTTTDKIRDAQILTDEEIEEWKELYGEERVKTIQLDTHGIKSPKVALWTWPEGFITEITHCVDHEQRLTTASASICWGWRYLSDLEIPPPVLIKIKARFYVTQGYIYKLWLYLSNWYSGDYHTPKYRFNLGGPYELTLEGIATQKFSFHLSAWGYAGWPMNATIYVDYIKGELYAP